MRLGYKFYSDQYDRSGQIVPINSGIHTKSIIKLFNLGKNPKISIEIFLKNFKLTDRLLNNTNYNLTQFVELSSGRTIINWMAYHNQFSILKVLINDFSIHEFDVLLDDFSLPVNVYELFANFDHSPYDIKSKIIGRYQLALSLHVNDHFLYLTSFVKKYDLINVQHLIPFKWHLGVDSLTLLKMYPLELIDCDMCQSLIDHLEENWVTGGIYCQWGLECLNWIVFNLVDSLNFGRKFTSWLRQLGINSCCRAIIIKLGENIKTRDAFFKCFARLEWAHGKPYLTDLRNLYNKVQKDEWNSIEPIISQRFRGVLLTRFKEFWEDNFHLIRQPPITTGAFAEFH